MERLWLAPAIKAGPTRTQWSACTWSYLHVTRAMSIREPEDPGCGGGLEHPYRCRLRVRQANTIAALYDSHLELVRKPVGFGDGF